jgi:hypothetical protein
MLREEGELWFMFLMSEARECDDEYCALMINQNRVSSIVLVASPV